MRNHDVAVARVAAMSKAAGFAYAWEYRVRADAIAAFRDLYGPAGGWVRLFLRAEGDLHTELLQDVDDEQRFVSIDHWVSALGDFRFLSSGG